MYHHKILLIWIFRVLNIYSYPENRGLTVLKGEITLVLLKNYFNQKCQKRVSLCINEKYSNKNVVSFL